MIQHVVIILFKCTYMYNKDSAAFAMLTASLTFFSHQCFLHFFVIDNNQSTLSKFRFLGNFPPTPPLS